MNQHQSSMCQIELSSRKPFVANIVPAHFKVGVRKLLKESWVKIRCEHPSGNADSRTQPVSYRPSPSTNFQASPPSIDSTLLYMADRFGVVQPRQLVVSRLSRLACVIEQVL